MEIIWAPQSRRFVGGQLLYWPEDNGSSRVEDLALASAQQFDVRRELVLFSGLRGHAVSHFEGERYSLVFFTASEFQGAKAEDVRFLKTACGLPWPTEESLEYFKSLLAPCRNGCKSIRHMFGYAEKSSA